MSNESLLNQFETDVQLTHDFVQGDENTDVTLGGKATPSLRKLANQFTASGAAKYRDEAVAAAAAARDYRNQAANIVTPDGLASQVTQNADALSQLGTTIDSNNPEWLRVYTDDNGIFLWGIHVDGSIEWAKGVPEPVREEIYNVVGELIKVKVDKVEGKGLIDEAISSTKSIISNQIEFLEAVQDADGKLLRATDIDGVKHVYQQLDVHNALNVHGMLSVSGGVDMGPDAMSQFARDLKDAGYSPDNVIDWSSASSLHIPTPRLAMVNIVSSASGMPKTKTVNQQDWMEFWDMGGNYFKKRIINNAQGNSSMGFVKKNFAFDLCNDEWKGKDTFALTVGDWVPQDSFHAKAYYTDFFRGVAVVSYQLMDEVVRTRGIMKDRPWKKALIDMDSIGAISSGFGGIQDVTLQLDNGARCFPDGFPMVVYFNGEFYGLFAFQLKKHRDNMHMSKSTAEHIHLDGTIDFNTLFNYSGLTDFTIQWDKFEIRNPKGIYCMDGTKYDGDNPKEPIDENSLFYDSANKDHVLSAKVKRYIERLSKSTYELNALRSSIYSGNHTEQAAAQIRAKFEEYFDPENWIDYLIVSDVVRNSDGFSKNWQWSTYDGVHWFVNLYDVDMSFGGHFQGDRIIPPLTGHVNVEKHYPCGWIWEFYGNREFGTGEWQRRYAELRRAGLISSNHIVDLVDRWTKRIGADNYLMEFKQWPDSPCIGQNEINTDFWRIVTGDGGTYVMASESTYNANVVYAAGERCSYGLSSAMGYYTFEAVAETSGNAPIKTFRHSDCIYRLAKWVEQEISNMDTVYGYTD